MVAVISGTTVNTTGELTAPALSSRRNLEFVLRSGVASVTVPWALVVAVPTFRQPGVPAECSNRFTITPALAVPPTVSRPEMVADVPAGIWLPLPDCAVSTGVPAAGVVGLVDGRGLVPCVGLGLPDLDGPGEPDGAGCDPPGEWPRW